MKCSQCNQTIHFLPYAVGDDYLCDHCYQLRCSKPSTSTDTTIEVVLGIGAVLLIIYIFLLYYYADTL